MDYQHFLLYVRGRQAEMRAADERARLLRSAHASSRPAESPPRSSAALALRSVVRVCRFRGSWFDSWVEAGT
ncbi:MAG TPA: hypothetical protein VOB72_15775 [Candidatus Dormibacteraeota bacterium]|nr:hypothetical protein [Candidatus Dormibacteraeota bacterium]